MGELAVIDAGLILVLIWITEFFGFLAVIFSLQSIRETLKGRDKIG